ncbi:GIN domain-containing protein [Pelagibacterium halotolerans]|uniref:GIN domain-containing protein n=1 Tax=Pelagibacterium halotolerans TaxID=531813 RepID=UPI00384EE59C
MPALARAMLAALPLAALALPTAAQDQSYDLPPFTAVDIATGIKADITEATGQSVAATGAQNTLDDLKLEVRDGVLHAYIDWNFMQFLVEGGLLGEFLGTDDGVSLQIGMPQLDATTASSGATVTVGAIPNADSFAADASSGSRIVLSDLKAERVELNASSGASIRASGSCETVEADASSGANIEAATLACAGGFADAGSGATIDLKATDTLKADASSGAQINVSGNPADVETEESFGGDVRVN